jgi:hypothetical protein
MLRENDVDFNDFSDTSMSIIEDLILSTKFPPNVELIKKDVKKQIICDADVANFGRDDFAEKGSLLREVFLEGIEELGLKPSNIRSSLNWYSNTLKAMKCYFFTQTARMLFQSKKNENEKTIVEELFRILKKKNKPNRFVSLIDAYNLNLGLRS